MNEPEDQLLAYLADVDSDEYAAAVLADEPEVLGDDEADAVRLLRRIAWATRRTTSVEAAAREEVRRVEAWAAEQTDGPARLVEWCERSLEVWMRRHNERTGAKTVKLPSGELRLRAGKIRIEAAALDAAAADALAAIDGDLVRRRYEVAKTRVVEVLVQGPPVGVDADGHVPHAAVDPASGEVVAGVMFLVPSRPSFGYTPRG